MSDIQGKGSRIVECVLWVLDFGHQIDCAWVRPCEDRGCTVHTTRIVMHDGTAYRLWIDRLLTKIGSEHGISIRVGGPVPEPWVAHLNSFDHVSARREGPQHQIGDHSCTHNIAIRALMKTVQSSASPSDVMPRYCHDSLDGCLMIDRGSLNALGISSPQEKTHSIVKTLLSYCATSEGKRRMREWFAFPLPTREGREQRLDMIQTIIANRHAIDPARKFLKGMGDPLKILESMWRNQTLPKPANQTRNFIKLKTSLDAMMELQGVCSFLSGEISLLDERHLADVHRARFLIEKIIDANQLPDGTCIQFGVSSELDAMKATHFEMEGMMQQLLSLERERIPKSLRYGEMYRWEMVHVHQVGVFVHCPEGILPSYLEDALHDWTLACEPGAGGRMYPGALYVTESSASLHDRFGNIFPKILDLEASILTNLTNRLLQMRTSLQSALDAVSVLDCTISLAIFSMSFNLSRPEYSNSRDLIIEDGWNPVVLNLGAENSNPCIPNNTHVQGAKRTHVLISEAPASGKTCYLQQVPIIVFLAHIGCFVPAKRAIIPEVDRIFVKLAPEESVHDSSFSSALKSIAEMMHYSTSNSLCAIECFGRSTVSSDGAALAAAVLEDLCRGESSPVVLFATHMGQILLDSLQCIQRCYDVLHFAFVEASNSNGEPTVVHLYKLRHGIPQRLGQNEHRILCNARPQLIARSANIMKLMSSETNTTLSRHPKFSLFESLNLIEGLKNVSEKHGATSLIQSI